MEDTSPSTNPVPPSDQPGLTVEERKQRTTVILASLVVIVLLALTVLFFVFLLKTDPGTASRLRDIFIIFMALESIIIGAALVILVVQLAMLINLLQNEIRPILISTNETVNTVKGTVVFLSDNLAEPVIKLNEYLAGFKKVMDLFRPIKK